MPGLYEVRINGIEIFYTDEQGNYLLQGNLIDVEGAPQPHRGTGREAQRGRLRQAAA